MRDAGLSIKTWMDINDNDYNTCREVLEAYLGWVGKVQQKNDPNGKNIGQWTFPYWDSIILSST